ncbi:DMT family transporter [Afipia sp. P52-10]|jgi:drug/metabolite transporter (DMT)-like permease|uniref:DMT family transporter n=1 Tax=Afipia sp. P52-10 TaxID=1429916 RepID=UPI0004B6D059|nr:DMT family transporter [Afipia sp. P52-10]
MAQSTEAALPPARPLDFFAVSIMLLLCLSWGINNVMVKLALPEVPPLMQATVRSIGGFVVIVVASWFRGIPLFRRDGTLKAGLLMGAVFATEFVLIFFGLIYTTASRAVIFLYTAPLFVAFGAVNLLGETLRPAQWGGLGLAFLGIVVAIGVPQADVDSTVLFGDMLLLLGALGWGGTTLIFKASNLSKAPAEKTLVYQTGVSAPLLGLGSLALGETMTAMPGPVALGSLVYQTVWVVGITFLLWYVLMKHYSASKLTAFTFITPLFGVAAGHLILNEPVTPAFAAAVALVIAGLFLVNKPGRRS